MMQFHRALLSSSSSSGNVIRSRLTLNRSFATTNLRRMSSSNTASLRAVSTLSSSIMGGFTSSLNLRREETMSSIRNGRGVQNANTRLFSTAVPAPSPITIPGVGKLGLGGYKWSQMEASRYYAIVQIALENGMTVLEAGQEGGDRALTEAYEHAVTNNPALKDVPVQVLARIGYRTIIPPDVDDVEAMDNPGPSLFLPHDVQVEKRTVPDDQSVTEKAGKKPQKVQQVVHNIGGNAVHQALVDSPLTALAKKYPNVSVVAMLHNPEVQTTLIQDQSKEERRTVLRERLTEGLTACQEQVNAGKIASYGIASNGLGLPAKHPLHLSWGETVLPAATAAATVGDGVSNFSVVQFPMNLLETTGLDVARQIRADCAAEENSKLHPQVYAMRPLSCYPDAGTGDGFPFVLADYLLPATMEKSLQWSNTMAGPPAAYELALQTAMTHFDAEEILQLKQEGADLTTEQRETLDGCKLLHSLLHDVDIGLEKVRSFAAHEQDLYEKIIPLIHDTFEGYDEETAAVLQSFFAAYSLAVKHAIARNTRALLQEGGGSAPVYADIPQETRLQEYALQFLFQEPAVDMVIAGCSHPDQLLDMVGIAGKPLPSAEEEGDQKEE
jgi:aryl-alcohol dehydrogenase-like predicted oxidoreductase